jgi:TonB family protein
MPFRTVLAGLALLLALSPAFAQTAQVQKDVAPREPLKEKWLAALKETDQMLRAHQWEAAAKRGRKAGEEIVNLAGAGDSPAYSLAVVDVFRAIAEAELGHQEEAEWLWESALNLFPDVAKTDLSPYGKKALELRRLTLREPNRKMERELLDRMKGKDGEEVFNPSDAKVEPPRIVHQTRPEYPKALRLLLSQGRVAVSSVIGKDGRPRQPVIVDAQGGGASMRYVALETVGQWRFEPARLDGQPVAVYYVLTISFKIGS